MVKGHWRVIVGLVAIVINLVGIYYFLRWLGKTDFMFGHFTGPAQWILTALVLCAAGIIVSLWWLLDGLYRRFRSPQPRAPTQGIRWLGVFQTVLLILLLLPSSVAVLTGFEELPRARSKMRRGQVLSQAERHGARAIPQLIEALEDEDALVQENAILSLSKFGPESKDAVPALARTLLEATTGGYADLIARDAAEALGKIGPDAAPAIPALVEAIKRGSIFSDAIEADDVDLVRTYASKALAKIGPAALPALSELLTDDNPNIRYWTVKALGQMGAESKPALPCLVEALQDDNEVVRQAIRIAVVDCLITNAQLPKPPAAGSPLDNSRRFRTLTDKIPSGDVPDLLELFDVNDNYVRFGAVVALAEKSRNFDRLDSKAKAAIVQGLGDRLKDARERADTRLLAVLTLLEISSTAESVTQPLVLYPEIEDPLYPLIEIMPSSVSSTAGAGVENASQLSISTALRTEAGQ